MVEDEALSVGDGFADGYAGAVISGIGEEEEGGADGGFGGAVSVDEAAALSPGDGDIPGEALAGGDDDLEIWEVRRGEDTEKGWREGDVSDALRAEDMEERVWIAELLARGEDEGAAAEEGGEDLGDGCVEAEGSEL